MNSEKMNMAKQEKEGKDNQAEYFAQLRTEFGQLDQSLVHTNRIVQTEIDRIIKGGDGAKPIEIHRDTPMKLTTKIVIPVKEYPKVNFVGKLIGPGGSTMKRLQVDLGVRIAVYGRGSMRDKKKEEELRKEGGKKYGHLNDDLHIFMECLAPADQAYQRIGRALQAIKPYFDPTYEDGAMPPPPPPEGGMPFNGTSPRGRGGRGRGGVTSLLAANTGIRGGTRGLPRGTSRGAPRGSPRGAPRGAIRGSRGRGAPAERGVGRGAAAQQNYADDDYYGAAAAPAAYNTYETDTGYEQDAYREAAPAARDPYSARPAPSSVQSFDYGHGSQTADASYEAEDTWEHRDPYTRPPAPRARQTTTFRQHPYGERPARQPAPRY